MKKITFLLLALILILAPGVSLADIGVGVATGKIVVDNKMKAGGIYEIPSFTVVNTGDVPFEYEVYTQYLIGQEDKIPNPEWFKFSPQKFPLDPGKGQAVEVTISLPLKDVQPGQYFAFLEAKPSKEDEGGTKVNIAAATKLYFTVAPANFFQGIYYRISSLMNNYSPWTYIALGIIVLAIIISLIKRKFNFDIGISVKKK